MKTINDIMDIVGDAISQSVQDLGDLGDYEVVVMPERIFNDDYRRADRSDLLRDNNQYGIPEYTEPVDVPGQKKIFIVVKFGQGQINKAVLTLPVSIQCLSEQDDYMAASRILRKFCNDFNFEYYEGIVMSFYTPEMISSAEEVYSGYRALMACKGSVKVPDDGLVFVTEVWSVATIDNEDKWFKIPFINTMDNWNAQTDPQAFSGFQGRTMNMNRQGTETVSFSSYLWNYTNDQVSAGGDNAELMKCLNNFSRKVLSAPRNINTRFRLYFKTNLTVSYGDDGWDSSLWNEIKNTPLAIDQDSRTYSMPSYEGYFTLVSRGYSQPWGDINAWSLTFAESREEG